MLDSLSLFYALAGGILPALIWLFFWLREDGLHPEPRRLVLRTFVLGMISVAVVLPLQQYVDIALPGMTLATILAWVSIEEIGKFLSAYLGGISTRANNEPLDPMIYVITGALGFVALENTLFIIGPLVERDFIGGILTGNMRFMGASLLHVVASAFVGMALAFTYYKPLAVRFATGMIALVIAIIFHLIFNLLLLDHGERGGMFAFAMVWLGVIFTLLAFEKAKRIARHSN